MQSFLIHQAFVYGDSLQHYLVAVIVPDKHCVDKWVANNGVKIESAEEYEEFLRNDKRI